MIDWNKPIQTCFGSPAELVGDCSVPSGKVVRIPKDNNDLCVVNQEGILIGERGPGVCPFIENGPQQKVWRNVYINPVTHDIQLGPEWRECQQAKENAAPESGWEYVSTAMVNDRS